MKYTVEKSDDYALVQLHEEKLDSIIAPDIKTELVLLINEGFKNIVLNLADVEFVDSSGLSAILVGNRSCENAGGVLILTNLHANVKRLVIISKLTDLLKIIPTVEEARDYLMFLRLEQEIAGEEAPTEE